VSRTSKLPFANIVMRFNSIVPVLNFDAASRKSPVSRLLASKALFYTRQGTRGAISPVAKTIDVINWPP